MWTLPKPDTAKAIDELLHALARDRGPAVYSLSADERAEVAALYLRYDALFGQPDDSLKPASLNAACDSIHDAYGQVQKDARLSSLRGALLAGLMECPLCGFGEPRTLDHYLPRSGFKSLAVYARNLIPSCQPCNRAKGIEVPGAVPGFVHSYFQDLPDEPFLHAVITYTAPALLAEFRIDHPTLDPNVQQRLRHQVEKLGLNSRYVTRINTLLFGLKVSVLGFTVLNDGPAKLKDFFEQCAASYAGDFGRNHWKTALMRGLADCDAFCADPQPFFAAPAVVPTAA